MALQFSRLVYYSRFMTQCCRNNTSLFTKYTQEGTTYKYQTTDTTKNKLTLKKEKEKLNTYIVQRYVNYVKNYNKVLEQRFPTAIKMYRVFSVGIKDFYKDLKLYISLRIKVMKHRDFSNLTRQDIELYQKMPQDMLKIAPVLILSAIPFGNYFIFPLAFFKPRSLLCSHFWSIQQQAEFPILDLTARLRHNRPVFRALQAQVKSIEDPRLKDRWEEVVGLLGSGVHPAVSDVIACSELFTNGPYQLSSLSYNHCGHLLKMHGLRKGVLRRQKLKYRAFLLLEIDRAILREGGVEQLASEALRHSCHMRGLNSAHLSNAEMRAWLQQWLDVSQRVDKTSYSLLLHLPIFLAYNHPRNWILIY